MNGMPVDYDLLLNFARKNKLEFISDSAESLGAIYKNKKLDQLHQSIFCFFQKKNTGEGGIITLSDKNKFNKLKILRNMGQTSRYFHKVLGYNYRMTDISASIGLIQLKKINKILKEKNKISKIYDKLLINDLIQTPKIPKYVTRHAWYSNTVKIKKNKRYNIQKNYMIWELKLGYHFQTCIINLF